MSWCGGDQQKKEKDAERKRRIYTVTDREMERDREIESGFEDRECTDRDVYKETRSFRKTDRRKNINVQR